MGAFVDKVPQNFTTVGSPYELITARIEMLRSFTNEWKTKLDTAVENLEGAVTQYTPHNIHVLKNINSFPNIAFPSAPDTEGVYDFNFPNTNIAFPVLKTIDTDLSFQSPIKPEAINTEFLFTGTVYSSQLLQLLYSVAYQSLLDGGTGFTQEAYDAILQRNREARRRAQDVAYREALDEVGSQGLNLPGGMAAAVILEMQEEVLAKEVDAVNNITVKDFEITDANSKFIKEWSLKIEEYNDKVFEDSEQRKFEVAKVSTDLAIQAYEQAVKSYIAEWEGVKAELQAKKTQIDAVTAYNDAQIKGLTGKLDLIKTQIQAISEKNKTISSINLSKAQIYESQIKGLSSKYDALIREILAQTEVYKADIDEVLGIEKLNLQAYSDATKLSSDAAQAIARVASQAVASALGAINANMGYNYQGSEHRSSSVSNNLTESHSYKEE